MLLRVREVGGILGFLTDLKRPKKWSLRVPDRLDTVSLKKKKEKEMQRSESEIQHQFVSHVIYTSQEGKVPSWKRLKSRAKFLEVSVLKNLKLKFEKEQGEPKKFGPWSSAGMTPGLCPMRLAFKMYLGLKYWTPASVSDWVKGIHFSPSSHTG